MSATPAATEELALDPQDNERLANLCGQFDEHLRQIEMRLGVEVHNRGNLFRIEGEDRNVRSAAKLLRDLYKSTAEETLTPARLNLLMQDSGTRRASRRAG